MGDSSGMMPPPPYEYVPNNESILPFTDFVCVDPVGTGFSRPAKPEYGSKFWGVQEDINSVGEFIRTFLTNENKWLTPLFLLGESYGTTRAAGLSNWLTSHGVGVNGIVFVSTVLNFASQDTSPGNDIPYAFYLPSFTATAHYHKKLAADLQKRPVESVLDEVRKFIYDEYLPALAKGDSMSETEQKKIAAKLSHYTSIPAQFILDTKLRIRQNNFWKELLRDEKYTVGRLDARFKGMDRLWNGQGPDYDASNTAIAPPYTSCMNHYVRNDLGYKTDAPYYVLGEGIGRWNWGDQPVDTSAALRTAMVQNPFLKSLFACGYYDMATPFGSVEFTVNQMNLDARVRGNVSFTYYTAGHMMYLDDMNRKKLRDDVRKFMESSVKK
jgi:carboxypeptidase C (cathepsin A)